MNPKHLLLGLAFLCLSAHGGKGLDPRLTYARLDIARLDHAQLDHLKHTKGIRWWVELDQTLLVLTHRGVAARLADQVPVHLVSVTPRPKALVVLGAGHGWRADGHDGDLLAAGGRFAVVQLHEHQDPAAFRAAHEVRGETCGAAALAFVPNTVLARDVTRRGGPLPSKFRAEVQTLVDAVDPQRWYDDVTTLADFSRQTGTEGVDDAAAWLLAQFARLPGVQAVTQPFTFNGINAKNVVATLPGTTHPEDLYIVGGHYDAIGTRDSGTNAPGAEDNGSGTAAVLEMARIFSAFRPNATYIFICYSGEEQGLFGSRAHLARLQAEGLTGNIKAVCTMDMIGYSSDPDLDVLLETGGAGIPTLDIWSVAAADYTTLRVVTSTNPFGSDHVPYINAGLPALLTIENEYDSYPGYHRSNDTAEKVSPTMGGEVIRMNVAALAGLSGFQGFDDPVWVAAP